MIDKPAYRPDTPRDFTLQGARESRKRAFRTLFINHLAERIKEIWADDRVEMLARRISQDDGYISWTELSKDDASMLDEGVIEAVRDVVDPTVDPMFDPVEIILNLDTCALFRIRVSQPSPLAEQEDSPDRVVLLAKGWSVADFVLDWTQLDVVDN